MRKAEQGQAKANVSRKIQSKGIIAKPRPSSMWWGSMRRLATQGKEKGARQGRVIFSAAADKISAFPET
jgi:hypothetical protein